MSHLKPGTKVLVPGTMGDRYPGKVVDQGEDVEFDGFYLIDYEKDGDQVTDYFQDHQVQVLAESGYCSRCSSLALKISESVSTCTNPDCISFSPSVAESLLHEGLFDSSDKDVDLGELFLNLPGEDEVKVEIAREVVKIAPIVSKCRSIIDRNGPAIASDGSHLILALDNIVAQLNSIRGMLKVDKDRLDRDSLDYGSYRPHNFQI